MAEENIFVFVPNLIGFVRVLLIVASCFFMATSPWVTVGLYLSAVLLDELDGEAARYFQQGGIEVSYLPGAEIYSQAEGIVLIARDGSTHRCHPVGAIVAILSSLGISL